jgi:hypothetical protein
LRVGPRGLLRALWAGVGLATQVAMPLPGGASLAGGEARTGPAAGAERVRGIVGGRVLEEALPPWSGWLGEGYVWGHAFWFPIRNVAF